MNGINYKDYFRHSWPYLETLKEWILVIRADRNIGKTTLLFDIIDKSFEKEKNIIFLKANDEVCKTFKNDFDSYFAGKYKTDGRGFIHKVEYIKDEKTEEIKQVISSKILGAICGWGTLHRYRSQVGIQNLEYMIFDEYNISAFAPKNFWEDFYQIFWTFLRDSKCFKKCIFVANRDGDINNDVENSFGLNFTGDNKEEENQIISINYKDVQKEYREHFKGLLGEDDINLIRGINCGKFCLPERESDKIMAALSLMSENTINYYMGKPMYKRKKLLCNFRIKGIYNKWNLKWVVAIKQDIIGFGIYEGYLYAGLIYNIDTLPNNINVWALTASDINNGNIMDASDKEDFCNMIINYHSKSKLLFAEKFSYIETFAIIDTYKNNKNLIII